MKKGICFFIDPMSYGTIAQYDRMLLNGIVNNIIESHDQKYRIKYFCSRLLPYKYSCPIKTSKIFFYNKIPTSLFKGISYLLSYIILLIHTIYTRPDKIHIQWIRLPKLDLLFLKIFKRLNCEIIYTAHNLVPHNNSKRSKELEFKKYYKKVDKIIVHSVNTKLELNKTFGIDINKIFVIAHGLLPIEADNSKVETEIQNINKQFNLRGKIVISCLGVQSNYKGSDLIVDAWNNNSELHQNGNVLLIIAGKSKNINFNSIKRYSNVVIEEGFLTNERYLAYLKLSDITLLPYRQISQSGSLLTALREKIPVMVSSVGGLTDPLKIADVGWSLGMPNEINLSNCLIDLLKKPKEISQKKDNEGEWSKLFHALSWDGIGKNTLEIYNKDS